MRHARFLSIGFLLLGLSALPLRAQGRGYVIVVHGGAGVWNDSPERLEQRRAAIRRATEAGAQVLGNGGPALDGVEAALVVMEDSGLFDAGRGAYYTREGVPELDAAIMDGRTRSAGAVAAVKRIANPIHLARMVMERTKHVLIVGEGAEDFARSQGIPLVSPYHFFREEDWRRWQKRDEDERKKPTPSEPGHGTVGAVVLDRAGNLAAGTSTGGTTFKMPGRVGDSPIIGAGTYASNESCAVSGTGVGEFYIRNVVAADIAARVKYLKQPLAKAAEDVVHELTTQKGEAGVIALDRDGHVATPFNTDGMMRAVLREGGKITVQVRNEPGS